jgi:cytochrome c oxidase subunit II
MAIPTIATIFALAREPEGALQVTVTAHQWWWEYEYHEEGVITANELHIPAGRPVFLALESEDVIHSYWVPRLAGKIDVVPGRTNHLTIEADEPGEYHGTCAEYCGLSHANMRFRVFAHTPADYERWVQDQLAPPAEPATDLERRGLEIFSAEACVACHTVQGVSEARVGPDLTHFASRTTFAGSIFDRTDEHLAAWLRDAPGVKPGALMPRGIADLGLSEDDIDALVAYLQSLE